MKPIPDTLDLIRLDIQNLTELPASSPIIQQLLDSLGNDDIDIRELAEIIRQDIALIARIIGLANSAYFGYPEPITRVEDAIFKALGISLTRNLALSIVLVGSFRPRIECKAFSINDFWTKALLTATLSSELWPHINNPQSANADDAYLAGILHDFGILPILYLYSDDVCKALDNLTADDSLTSCLKSLLGTDHHQIGFWLASKWKIPPNITSVIAHNQDADYEGRDQQLVQLIHASQLCASAYLKSGDWLPIPETALTLVSRLGISEEHMHHTLIRVGQKSEAIAGIAALLSLE